jgi:hypothetical protein
MHGEPGHYRTGSWEELHILCFGDEITTGGGMRREIRCIDRTDSMVNIRRLLPCGHRYFRVFDSRGESVLTFFGLDGWQSGILERSKQQTFLFAPDIWASGQPHGLERNILASSNSKQYSYYINMSISYTQLIHSVKSVFGIFYIPNRFLIWATKSFLTASSGLSASMTIYGVPRSRALLKNAIYPFRTFS